MDMSPDSGVMGGGEARCSGGTSVLS
jgi:hypothetical protein